MDLDDMTEIIAEYLIQNGIEVTSRSFTNIVFKRRHRSLHDFTLCVRSLVVSNGTYPKIGLSINNGAGIYYFAIDEPNFLDNALEFVKESL